MVGRFFLFTRDFCNNICGLATVFRLPRENNLDEIIPGGGTIMMVILFWRKI